MYVLLLLLVALAQSCHTECRYICDDPVCRARCRPICSAPRCQRCVNTTQYGLRCRTTGSCSVRCPVDQCEADACPQCETVCPDLCHARANCTVLCQAPECTWQCEEPSDQDCPRPRCVRQCEEPACMFTGDNSSSGASAALGLLLLATLSFLL